mmetsp:Transcript_61/g.201  ORF Transcript_61/g.201 Transcript_61/m.201 type:complete len:220 (-) Transcript_61:123-782(-)
MWEGASICARRTRRGRGCEQTARATQLAGTKASAGAYPRAAAAATTSVYTRMRRAKTTILRRWIWMEVAGEKSQRAKWRRVQGTSTRTAAARPTRTRAEKGRTITQRMGKLFGRTRKVKAMTMMTITITIITPTRKKRAQGMGAWERQVQRLRSGARQMVASGKWGRMGTLQGELPSRGKVSYPRCPSLYGLPWVWRLSCAYAAASPSGGGAARGATAC